MSIHINILFIHSSADEHLGYFYLLSPANNTSITWVYKYLFVSLLSILLGITQKQNYYIGLYGDSKFWRNCHSVCYRKLCHFTFPSIVLKSFNFFICSSTLVIFHFSDHRLQLSTKELVPLTCGGKTLKSPLDSKEVKPVHSKGTQPWGFTGRTDAEAEARKLWPSDARSWFIGKDFHAGKDWRKEETGMTEDEMVGWHH